MNRHWGNATNSCLYRSSPACNNLRGNYMEKMIRRLEEQGSTRFGGTRFSGPQRESGLHFIGLTLNWESNPKARVVPTGVEYNACQWRESWKRMFRSDQISRSVVSDSLRPHELQHARPPCPSPTLEFTQTHVHRVSDAIQPSHPLSFPSPPAPNPSQHRSLFRWVNSSREVAKVLEFQL